TMQCTNAPSNHANQEVQSWYSAGMTESPAGARSHAKLRGCIVLDAEKDFLKHLMQNTSVWSALVTLNSAIAVQNPDECGILQRLYYIMCRTTAALFDDSTHHKNVDDDYLIMVEGSDRVGKSRITAADREYFNPPINFGTSMVDSLQDTLMRESVTPLLEAVVCDVFSFALSGTLNFNFYEECAYILHTARELLKRYVHQLPREHVREAWLARDYVV
ncbi:hypothetical protein AAVH_38483, partial [Aphelenchoides avenae]